MLLPAVDVGVVEEVDAGVACGADQGADLLVGLLGDPHQAEHDVRGGDVGVGEGELLHGMTSSAFWAGRRLPAQDARAAPPHRSLVLEERHAAVGTGPGARGAEARIDLSVDTPGPALS
ncbi:hypothetical protein [Brachybacterium sp. GPGPB12]|uniref:hypothetical protein n=1 Tax=Brachybacterium sp. GPGPB12 TaxID=3023517 RepID=UPI0031343E38